MPPTSLPTRSGPPRLSEQARLVVAPTGIVSTGWPAVRKTCVEKLGIEFDPWQDAAGRLILAKREDGNLAAMIDGVGISIPRQVGKTYLIGAMVFALCVNTPGLLVIWSAHHARTHGETFLAMQAFAERSKVQSHIAKVYTGSGDEEIRFHNRSRILFGARERGFGRGIPGVDVLIFDEAQILSDKALANMLATMNTSKFGLQLYVGTPPKPEDMSESFERMRTEAQNGTLLDGAWIEFGADSDAKSDDRAQWRKMNPSYPARTPVQSLLRLKRKLTPDDWRREGMGIWDDKDSRIPPVIGAGLWRDRGSEDEAPDGDPSYGIRFSIDGTSIGLSVAVQGPEKVRVELIDLGETVTGLSKLVKWCSDRADTAHCFVVDGKSHRETFVRQLIDAGVSEKIIVLPTTDQVIAAHSMFLDAVQTGTMDHFAGEGQEELDSSVAHAQKRKIGNAGGWGWGPIGDGDVTALDSATLAYYGALAGAKKKRSGRAVFR